MIHTPKLNLNKNVIALSGLLLLTLALAAGSVYQFKRHQNVTDAAVVRANQERDAASAKTEAYALDLKSANSQVQSEVAKKLAVCAHLKSLKATDVNCQ